jgi:hypothetical protein
VRPFAFVFLSVGILVLAPSVTGAEANLCASQIFLVLILSIQSLKWSFLVLRSSLVSFFFFFFFFDPIMLVGPVAYVERRLRTSAYVYL